MAEYIEREAAIDAVFGAMADGRAVFPALNNLPAADVRPVVRGKWVKSGEIMYCRNCNYIALNPHHYCPNCGADMRNADD